MGAFFMIVGRVDEMMNGKVHGWAFNSDQPDEHVEIRISRGSELLASGIADGFRKDLPDAGVGDGHHAFAVKLPDGVSSFQGLQIVARSADDGEMVLPIASKEDRKLDDLFYVFSQRYDDLLISMKADIDVVRTEGAPLLRAELEERLAKLERRLEDFEVFVIRLDEITSKLQERVGLLRPKGFFSWFRRK